MSEIRNIAIIAHVDHGKTTLVDQIMRQSQIFRENEVVEDCFLDNNDLERERGITIKLTPTRMNYNFEGETYTLNLIDTPGHVDFTYEVSRSLCACEGAILVVDASQGVEAQTLANAYLAIENNLEILPVINKIDLPSARVEEVKKEIEDIIGLPADDIPCISAKEGINIEDVLNAVVKLVPPPSGEEEKPLKALIFDSFYDNFKGAISLIRVVDGCVKPGDKIKMMATGKTFDVTEVGVFVPTMKEIDVLRAGDVGYLAGSIKNVADTKVGDTITTAENGAPMPLSGYKEVLPVVFCGVFCVDGSKYEDLKVALEKLALSDASLVYEPEVSQALGFGFRCGFLGLLHMEIITERLEREYNLDLITTAPSVNYHVHTTKGEVLDVSNPCSLPPATEIDYIEEPIVNLSVYTPPEYVGAIMELCQEKRGVYKDLQYIDSRRTCLKYTLPLNEMIYEFFDAMKSRTKGYASLDYEPIGFARSSLVRLDILLNGEICDALSLIVHKDKAYSRGRGIAEKLKKIIPRQLFEVPIQACIGSKVIARETISAMRKDVLAKCYGGDISRKRKLLEKQKAGKKRMRQIGSVEVPSEAFMSLLKVDEDD